MTKNKTENPKLPVEWRWVKLGDVCETTSGGTPNRGNDNYFNGSIPWIKSGELRDGYITETEECISQEGLNNSSAKMIPANTLMMAMYGATVGRLGISKIRASTNQAVCSIITGNTVNQAFLFFHLLQYREQLLVESFGGAQPNISQTVIRSIPIPLPPLPQQKRIAGILTKQMAAAAKAKEACQEKLAAAEKLSISFIEESLKGTCKEHDLNDCLEEVKTGIGETWDRYRLIGATRSGIAAAKEGVGKKPERYKLVDGSTVFYNPMRIKIGSIAFVDEKDEPGITSPDYVVLKGNNGILDTRWFYYWFRSPHGERLIESLSRGAVRERILFNRLSKGKITLPSWNSQKKISKKLENIPALMKLIAEELAEINKLPASLLQQTFEGKL